LHGVLGERGRRGEDGRGEQQGESGGAQDQAVVAGSAQHGGHASPCRRPPPPPPRPPPRWHAAPRAAAPRLSGVPAAGLPPAACPPRLPTGAHSMVPPPRGGPPSGRLGSPEGFRGAACKSGKRSGS